jgi:hypothetical protein
MEEALIDTDILSEVFMAKDARVLANLQKYLVQHCRLAFSSITCCSALSSCSTILHKRLS